MVDVRPMSIASLVEPPIGRTASSFGETPIDVWWSSARWCEPGAVSLPRLTGAASYTPATRRRDTVSDSRKSIKMTNVRPHPPMVGVLLGFGPAISTMFEGIGTGNISCGNMASGCAPPRSFSRSRHAPGKVALSCATRGWAAAPMALLRELLVPHRMPAQPPKGHLKALLRGKVYPRSAESNPPMR